MYRPLSALLIGVLSLFSAASHSYVQASNESYPMVQILVASWCVHCREIEKFLRDEGIAYTSLDIERDPLGRKRYQQLGGGGVPMVIIGNSVLKGFDPQSILETLERYRSKPSQAGVRST